MSRGFVPLKNCGGVASRSRILTLRCTRLLPAEKLEVVLDHGGSHYLQWWSTTSRIPGLSSSFIWALPIYWDEASSMKESSISVFHYLVKATIWPKRYRHLPPPSFLPHYHCLPLRFWSLLLHVDHCMCQYSFSSFCELVGCSSFLLPRLSWRPCQTSHRASCDLAKLLLLVCWRFQGHFYSIHLTRGVGIPRFPWCCWPWWK